MQINSKELMKKLFLTKDKHGYIAWHRAAEHDNLEALWSCAKQVELNIGDLFLAKTGDGIKIFEIAASNYHLEILNRLSVWAEEM
jgi:hypothetical protein